MEVLYHGYKQPEYHLFHYIAYAASGAEIPLLLSIIDTTEIV